MNNMFILKQEKIIFKNYCEIFDKKVPGKFLLDLKDGIFANYLCDQGFEF